jgi:hypothetical protein
MAAFNFSNMFQAFSDANEKEWKYNRDLSLGASEVFACMRKAFFKKFGYEPDDGYEADWGAAKRGDIIENYFAVPAVNAVLEGDAELIYAGEEQETLKVGRLSATPDGLVINADRDALSSLPNGEAVMDMLSDCFVTEFKSFDPRSNIKEAKPLHVGQVQVQLGLIHELTEYRPEYGLVIYFNASFFSDIRIFVVKRDPAIYANAVKRSKIVYATKEPKELMAEGKISGDCTYCEFTQECALAQGELMPAKKQKIADQEVIDRLKLLAERQKALDQMEKDAKADKKIAEEEIKELLRKHDTKGVGEEAFTISMSWINGKKSLDVLALTADLIDAGLNIEDYQKEGNGYERLMVKLKDNHDD